MGLGLAASVWLMRRLGLPLWWVLFPPLFHGIWNGNPQTVMLALLVFGGAAAATLAVGLKLYAAVVLLLRPRELVVAGFILAITALILPWQLFLQDLDVIAGYRVGSWDGSAWRIPILIPPTLLALWVLRHKGTEWFVVPAIWPETQFYYVAMALPAIVGRPLLAAVLALPVPLLLPIAVMVLAVLELRRDPAVLRPTFAMPRT
jgi:hypothetical protein